MLTITIEKYNIGISARYSSDKEYFDLHSDTMSVQDALEWARRVYEGDRDRELRCTHCGEPAVMGSGLNSKYTVCCGVAAAVGMKP